MSDIINPYESPENLSVPEKPLESRSALTETMLNYLKDASPWLRFIGVLGFIASGLMCIGGIIFMIVMFAASNFVDDVGGALSGLIGLIYVPMGALYFFPARFTYKFGAKIRDYRFTNADEDLELAFKNNKSLWKFLGILAIIGLAIIPLFLILALVGGIAAVAGGLFS